MPKIFSIGKMLLHIIQIIIKITFILILSQLLTGVQAGVIKKREIVQTTTGTPRQTDMQPTYAKVGIGTKVLKNANISDNSTKSAALNQLLEATTQTVAKDWDGVTSLPTTEIVRSKSKSAENQKNLTVRTATEGKEIMNNLFKTMQKESETISEYVKESGVEADHLDFREANQMLPHSDDHTTFTPEQSTTFETFFKPSSEPSTKMNLAKSLNETSKLQLPRSMSENENRFGEATSVEKAHSKTLTKTDISVTTTANADDMEVPELTRTTSSPNITENLAITMQKLKELVHTKNSSQTALKKQTEVSNEIIAPGIRTGSEKKAKFINDNSTNQLNLLNTSEVRTLLAMKTIPANKPVPAAVPDPKKTQQFELSTERNKNISTNTSSNSNNSEKNLLDWTQIMMNENMTDTKIQQDIATHNNSVAFETEQLIDDQKYSGKPYSTMITAADINSTTTTTTTMNAIDNDVFTTENIAEGFNITSTHFSTSLASTPTTNLGHTTIDLNAVTTATTSIPNFSDSSTATNMLSTSVEIKTSSSPLTNDKQSSNLGTQPVLVATTTIANINTDSIISSEFLSTTTKPTSSFAPTTTSMSTTMLSPSFPHDNENNVIASDKNSQSTIENTALSEATTQLSSNLTSPAQEMSDIIMENTTNMAKPTQATAIKSLFNTPKNLSTAIIEATTSTTTTETHISSTRQPLPENNLITNLHPPPPPATNNDNNYKVTVKIKHHNESYDERANARVVGEEATTLELSTSSATTVSSSEASAVSTTTALTESDGLDVETSTTAKTTTTASTTIELTTIMPSHSVRENIKSNTTAYATNQRVNNVDLGFTTTTERLPTSSSTLGTILKADIGEKKTTSFEEQYFLQATTPATLGGVLQKTTTESLSNFVETTTTMPTTPPASVTTTVYEDTTAAVFQNHSIHTDFKEAPKQLPTNSIDINLIDQAENKLNTLAVSSEAVDDVDIASTTPHTTTTTAMGALSSTTEGLLISLLDDSSTTSTVTSSPSSTSNDEVYEVVATTETPPNSPTTAAAAATTATTTTASYEPPPISSVPELTKIAATSIPTTMLPITLETVNSAGIGGGPHLQPDSIDPPEMDVNVIIAISISVIGIIALILLVAFLYVVRKRQKQISYGHRCRPVSLDAYSMDNVSVYNSVRRKGAMRSSKRSYGNVAFDDPSLTHNILNASELSKFIEKRSVVFEEFKYVPQIIARPDEVPAGCEDKNRYANVIPIPETRVSLQRQNDDEKSEYINANYVRGPRDSPNYYIACQAPLESTVDDFWRMIWEQKSRVIIQATDLVENGIEKCAEYLPPSVTLDNHTTYSDFQITLKHREVKDKYAISTLILKNTLVNSSRELTHYWYKWPETGVPNEEAPIIAMLLEARCSLKSYAVEEANDLKATMISKSDIISTLKQDDNEVSSTSSLGNHSENNRLESGNNISQSNADIDTNSSNDKSNRSAASIQQGPLTVHCSPGTGRTGTIIGCDIAIRSLETPKRNVDIPQIVYYVRRGRASAVQTKEQYEFIYKIATMYASKITNVSNET